MSPSLERNRVTRRFARSLARDDLVLHYQPIVSLVEGSIVAAEALIRWRTPRGWLAPGQFLPHIEGGRQVPALNAFVIASAVEQSRAWERANRAIQVSVNISPEALGHDLVDQIAGALARAELPAHLFHVELTELRTSGSWSNQKAEAFERLQQLGVSISIDDFGQGESSLWRLASLPVDVLKIDRGFIASMTDDKRSGSVVRSATELAHTLEMSAVAEGVEKPEQWHALRAWGCDFAQGFLLGRPVAPEAFMPTLERDVVPMIESLSKQVVPVERRVGPGDRRNGADRRHRGEGTWPRQVPRFARR